MSRARGSGPAGTARDPAVVMVAGGLRYAGAGAGLAVLVVVFVGDRSVVAALAGAFLALPGLLGVPGLMRVSRHWSPELAMASALVFYGVVIGGLWAVFARLGPVTTDLGVAGAVGFGATVVGWSIGVIIGMSGLRQHLWDVPGPEGSAPVGSGGEKE